MLSYIVTPNSLSVTIDGKTFTANSGHVNYAKIREKLRAKDFNDLVPLFDVTAGINAAGRGLVKVKNGEVTYMGQVIHNTLTMRMLDMFDEGFDIDPLVNFMLNLMQNPSKTAVDELYLWLETSNLSITPDGHFLAYKKVRGDYRDIHSATFDNTPGKICQMPRNQVDDNRNRTCSQGLHFCSESYLAHFGSSGSSDKVVLLKINPADVVSIPSDYSNAKGRTWKYEVLEDVTDRVGDKEFTKAVATTYHNKRDASGRFCA